MTGGWKFRNRLGPQGDSRGNAIPDHLLIRIILSESNDLQVTALRPGTAAKRLLAEDRRQENLQLPAGDVQPVASSALSRLVDAALPDADRSAYLCLFRRSQFHSVVLPFHRLATHAGASRSALGRDVRRGAATAARLPAEQQRFRHPQSAVPGERARPRAGAVVRDAANHLDRDLPAAGSCAQQRLGLQEESLVPDEPDGVTGPDAGLRMFGHAVDRADRTKPAPAGALVPAIRTSSSKDWGSCS